MLLPSAIPFKVAAEETEVPLLAVLSSTVISGYVDVSAVFSGPNTSAHGFAGTWVGIVTDRSSTNRMEFYLLVDEKGNLAGRAMNYDRTLGSEQIDGILNENGKAKIGQLRFHLYRRGVGTVIGRGESGRIFLARLLREKIRQLDRF